MVPDCTDAQNPSPQRLCAPEDPCDYTLIRRHFPYVSQGIYPHIAAAIGALDAKPSQKSLEIMGRLCHFRTTKQEFSLVFKAMHTEDPGVAHKAAQIAMALSSPGAPACSLGDPSRKFWNIQACVQLTKALIQASRKGKLDLDRMTEAWPKDFCQNYGLFTPLSARAIVEALAEIEPPAGQRDVLSNFAHFVKEGALLLWGADNMPYDAIIRKLGGLKAPLARQEAVTNTIEFLKQFPYERANADLLELFGTVTPSSSRRATERLQKAGISKKPGLDLLRVEYIKAAIELKSDTTWSAFLDGLDRLLNPAPTRTKREKTIENRVDFHQIYLSAEPESVAQALRMFGDKLNTTIIDQAGARIAQKGPLSNVQRAQLIAGLAS